MGDLQVVGLERILCGVVAHIDSAEVGIGNQIRIRGWLNGAVRGALEASSRTRRSVVDLEERPDVCRALGANSEHAFGFVCRLVNDDSFPDYPMRIDLWADNTPLPQIVLASKSKPAR